MRVWDVDPAILCRAHLLGEHAEIHAVWNVITLGRTGYAEHPEVRRWRGRLAALYRRHACVADEMLSRGYRHESPLDEALATGDRDQCDLIDSPAGQLEILEGKACKCPRVTRPSA